MLATLFRKRFQNCHSEAQLHAGATNPPAQPKIALGPGSSNLPGWIFLPTGVLVVAILYWAQEILVPMAVAILLTFVLAPVVGALEHLRLGRIPSVAIAAIFTLSILLGVGWVVVRQMASLADELPQYRRNIAEKIADLRDLKRGGALEKVEQTVEEVKGELENTKDRASEPPPRQVVVAAEEESAFWPIPLVTGPMLERLAAAGLAIALVIFMLIQREELRNRLIRILGYSRLTVTTKALEEAGQRISHYLLAQLLINSGFGFAVGILLFMLGVPYALLWGFMATLLRFIPYVGPWLGAIMPTALSLAHFQGWIFPLMVVGAFVLLELTTNLLLEPLLYGESAGVSEIAILTMAAFWTWLWGPVGLVLATPLTVCLVVFSKYVPEITFVTVLLSDAPALEPHVNYYQRMLALDEDEGEEIVEEYLKYHSAAELYDEVFIPALSRAKNDRRHGQLTEGDEQAVYHGTRAILEDLENHLDESTAHDEHSESAEPESVPPEQIVPIVGFPADGKADEVALLTFAKLLDGRRYKMDVISADMLASEMVSLVGQQQQTRLVCIGAIAPGGLARARYLCKRMRARFPEIKIIAGRWGSYDSVENARISLTSAGTDRVAATLLEARDQLVQLAHLQPAAASPAPARRLAE
ncbi:MAG: AI-2E family transporter [Candidatus Binatia bacterium]